MSRAPITPVTILLYHGVAEDVDGPLAPWVITPAEFERHLDVIEGEGCHVTTVGDHVAAVHDRGRPPDRRTVVLTFDDGFADFASGAFPALQRRRLPATLYVTSGGVGGTATWLPGGAADRPMLDWSTIGELATAGIEIGSHTHSHPELDLVPLREAREEIRRGRREIEDRLGRTVDTFAYPHGYHSRALCRAVSAEGLTSACAVGHALSSGADDRFALARVMVRRGDGPDRMRRWVRGTGLPVRPAGRHRPRAVAWRQARRLRRRRPTSSTAVR